MKIQDILNARVDVKQNVDESYLEWVMKINYLK
jgi:hypothetical protein